MGLPMKRDDRPLFHDELGIPWDEYQMACWLTCEGAIDQKIYRSRKWKPWPDSGVLWFDDIMADKIARPASVRLRRHPSHHVVGGSEIRFHAALAKKLKRS